MEEQNFETLFKSSLENEINEKKKLISTLTEDKFIDFLEKESFFDANLIPKHFKSNRNVALSLSKKIFFYKDKINEIIDFEKFKYDFEFVKNILIKNPDLISLIPIEILRLDDELVHSVCKKGFFKKLPEEMKKQEKFFKTAFKENCFVIKDSIFINDLKYINDVSDVSFIYPTLSEKLRDNKDLAIKALNSNFTTYKYMSERLKKNVDLAWSALKKSTYAYSDVVKYFPDNKEMLDFCVEKSLKDSANGFNFLTHANKKFLNDVEMARNILNTSGSVYMFNTFGDAVKNDDVCAVLAVSKDCKNFQYVSDRLKKDKDIIELAFFNDNSSAFVFKYLPLKYKANKDFVKKVLSFVKYGHIEIIKEVSDEIKDDILLIYPYIKDNVFSMTESVLSKRMWEMVEFLDNDEKERIIKTLFLKQDLPRVLEESKVNKKIKI